MIERKTACGLVVVLLWAMPVAAQDAATDKTIVWLKIDFPPFYIAEGPHRGEGIGDRIVDLLVENLGDYEHESQVAGPDRIFKEMERGRRVCSVAYIKTPERLEVMRYSIPDMILPPNGITVRRDLLERFTASGTGAGNAVSLETLLGRTDLSLGIAAGRSYGPEIDPLLERLGGSHVQTRTGEDIYGSLLRMLVRQRFDYILGYPYEANYVASQLGHTGDIVNLPITETASIFTLAHVVCPRNEWGATVIGKIDEILLRERPKDRYRQFFERWLDSEQLPAYRKAYAETFLTITDRP